MRSKLFCTASLVESGYRHRLAGNHFFEWALGGLFHWRRDSGKKL